MITTNAPQIPPTPIRWNLFGFLPYQIAWLENDARFKIGLWSRQTGKDFTCAGEAVMDCLHRPNSDWLILAASERQAQETLLKARDWTFRAHHFRGLGCPWSPSRSSSTEISFANGSRIIALPANAQTIRGYSANLILTEFAFHEQAADIWRAIYPSISNPMRGGLKKVRIISTPNGLNNKFAQLWNGADQLWFKSRVTIHDAVAAGLPVHLAEIRDSLNDPQAWAQEYECQFMDTSAVLLPYELIETCESPDAREHSDPLELSRCSGQLFAGIDFGRKQHLTVCWILERLHSPLTGKYELVTREVLTLHNFSTPDQIAALRPRLQRAHRVCLDSTGPGVGLGDFLVREFQEYSQARHKYGKVELCQFTSSLKAELFPRLRVAFENRELKIPATREIREDLHGVQRIVSADGHVGYRALSKPDGHSDRCTALALAVRAAGTVNPQPIYPPGFRIDPPPRIRLPARRLAA